MKLIKVFCILTDENVSEWLYKQFIISSACFTYSFVILVGITSSLSDERHWNAKLYKLNFKTIFYILLCVKYLLKIKIITITVDP